MSKPAASKLLDVEFYIEAANHHASVSDGDHEVGDLIEFLRSMWNHLTPEQRMAFAKDEKVHMTLDSTLVEFESELKKLP